MEQESNLLPEKTMPIFADRYILASFLGVITPNIECWKSALTGIWDEPKNNTSNLTPLAYKMFRPLITISLNRLSVPALEYTATLGTSGSLGLTVGKNIE